ncbi:adenylate/guanylate cyclase domain-containing protein [Dermatobacter hominis]|uniref:adenylate/guanylate cyclase domain-containing protein n=1 Tax=Dermatobacter hominis TaxID=2884263 RepID=UPI001D0F769D|nr:adenylate/guanylate cyclase domain-containing protein [Dermatobacter hominis]UDY37597.1 adenylate/guanylate cyclase domain-containing protein [Dermatobacter hominis]
MSTREALLEHARAAFAQSRWSAARSALQDADAGEPLGAEDLERLAWSCRWESDPAGFIDALERAEVAFAADGTAAGAARMALEQARHHAMMLDGAVALTCYVRATEHLADAPECAEHAQAQWSLAFTLMEAGDQDGAEAALLDAREIARRVGSPGMEAMAVQGLAHVAATAGEVGEVLPLLDEAAALAMRPGVAPIHAGYVYCAVISVCRALCDWGRATEWTKVSTRYCERESIAGYTGLCRFHQGEINRLHGHLAEAEQRVLQACEELLDINRYSAGWGYSELVEIRVRRGDLDGAEEALEEAIALGDDGQPGRGRLLLAQGDARAAVRSLHRSLTDPGFLARERRVFLIPVYVAACLAVGDEQAAAGAVEELEELARRFGTLGPAAAAAVARGHLALHRGRTDEAIAALREGVRMWSEVEAPYEAAQTRVLLARALTADGDGAGARLELKAAARLVDEFGVAVDLDIAPERAEGTRTVRTFLFSDIVDSTRLSEAMGDAAWEPLLQWHDRTLRAEFERWSGEEIKHGGDGFFVAFADADDAVECAVAVQRALARHRAEHGFALSVRIGLHVGEATARDADYFGSAVIRAARVSAAAGAGEVLVSEDVVAACRREVPVVGERTLELKGIAEPVVAALVGWDDRTEG